MNLFKNKYRIESTRLKNYDYSGVGSYFITICTKNKQNYFGYVVDGEMQLSQIGQIADQCWNEIPKHFPFVLLDEYVVMPNHVHGILIVNGNINDHRVETQNFASLHGHTNTSQCQQNTANKFGPQSMNLASIVRGYKIGVKKWATINNVDFLWQPRFYENIIRNENSLQKIRQYIIENPIKYNPENFEMDMIDLGSLVTIQ